MQDPQTDWRYWTGWIVTYCLAAGFFIYAVLHGAFDRPLCTGALDEQCLREWVSALGGWAAVAAAVPTILYLSRQIRNSERQHRDVMTVQLLRTRTVARRGLRRARQLYYLGKGRNYLSSADLANIGVLRRSVDEIAQVVSDRIFLQVEDEIDAADLNVDLNIEEVGKRIYDIRDEIDASVRDIGNHIGVGRLALSAHEYAEVYGKRCMETCEHFLLVTVGLTGIHHVEDDSSTSERD